MERVMSLLIEEFSLYAHVEIHLVLIGKERVVAYHLPKNVCIHKPKWEFNNAKRNLHTFKTILFIRKTVKTIDPSTILSFGEMWNNLVLLALTGKKYPVFISDRSTPNKNLGKLQNKLRDRLYPKAAGYIAQTEKAAYVASYKNWNSNIKIIGNPVPEIKLDRIANTNILTVGRLIKSKNVNRLIEIFRQVLEDSNQAKNWRLQVIGGNAAGLNILEELQQQVRDSRLGSYVALEGSRSNVLDYLANSEIFAFTSTSEGFPNALAEAMSAGLAVVAYDCMAGPSDLIDDGINGFLVPENDEELFKKRLITLVENAELRQSFGAEAQKKTRRFYQRPIAKKFLDFITPLK
jgi:glycosyltransferase involved in cell wall biosynthesis